MGVNTDVGFARNEQALCTQTSRWEWVSRGISKYMCNSNPFLVLLRAGGVMCEFRGCMCTSFQHRRMHERQVFEGDFWCVLKLQSAFQCWVIFMANFVEPRGKKWKIGEVQIKHEWMTLCMRGTWAGLCIFKNPLPAGLKDHRTSFVTRGCNYSAMGSGVQRLTQSGTDNRAVPVFPDNNRGEA